MIDELLSEILTSSLVVNGKKMLIYPYTIKYGSFKNISVESH